jgi:hypothetical protein
MASSSGRYAADTKVPVSQSIAEIERTVQRYGGAQFGFGVTEEQAVVAFTKEGRQVRFFVPFGNKKDAAYPKRQRQRMRALLLVIKARLEAVESGVESFEDSFMANIVLPDGSLVSHHVKRELKAAYETGQQPPALLPDYSA